MSIDKELLEGTGYMQYESPEIKVLGTIEELTLQFDKIGDVSDFLTPQVPVLDGSIVPDPA